MSKNRNSTELRNYRKSIVQMVLKDEMSFAEIGGKLGVSGSSISDVFHNYCKNRNPDAYKGLPRLIGHYYQGEPVLCQKPQLSVMRQHSAEWLDGDQGPLLDSAIKKAILLLVENGYQVGKLPPENAG